MQHIFHVSCFEFFNNYQHFLNNNKKLILVDKMKSCGGLHINHKKRINNIPELSLESAGITSPLVQIRTLLFLMSIRENC